MGLTLEWSDRRNDKKLAWSVRGRNPGDGNDKRRSRDRHIERGNLYVSSGGNLETSL